MARRRALSNLNVARTPFLVNLSAFNDNEDKLENIIVKSNIGYNARINVSEDMNFDNAIASINIALEEMRLLPVDSSLLFKILCQNLGDPIPKVIPASSIKFVCNTLQRNENLKPNFPKLEKDWTEAFNKEAERSMINKDGKENKRCLVLGVQGSAYSLLAENLAKFGGFSQNFSQWDAIGILQRCARAYSGKWIRCAEFCEAMKKAVVRVTKPSRIVAIRRSFSKEKLNRIIHP